MVADGIIAALGSDRFEHYVPDMKAVVDAKNADLDAFIAGCGRDGDHDEGTRLRRAAGALRGSRTTPTR